MEEELGDVVDNDFVEELLGDSMEELLVAVLEEIFFDDVSVLALDGVVLLVLVLEDDVVCVVVEVASLEEVFEEVFDLEVFFASLSQILLLASTHSDLESQM